jgi:hypothetical protein
MEFESSQRRAVRDYHTATDEYRKVLKQLSADMHFYDTDIRDHFDETLEFINDKRKFTDWFFDKYEKI